MSGEPPAKKTRVDPDAWKRQDGYTTRSGRTCSAPNVFRFEDFPDDAEVMREERLWEKGQIEDRDNDYYSESEDDELNSDDLDAIVDDDESISEGSVSESEPEDYSFGSETDSEYSLDSELLEDDDITPPSTDDETSEDPAGQEQNSPVEQEQEQTLSADESSEDYFEPHPATCTCAPCNMSCCDLAIAQGSECRCNETFDEIYDSNAVINAPVSAVDEDGGNAWAEGLDRGLVWEDFEPRPV